MSFAKGEGRRIHPGKESRGIQCKHGTMRHVTVGYGEYNGYRLTELPAQPLNELAARYPLCLDEQLDHDELVIIIGVHGELHRRENGGKQEQRVPTLRELAEEIVSRGYQQASKLHHPDGKGNHDAQIRLNKARDELRNTASNLSEESDYENVTIIPAPPAPRTRAAPSSGIGDDDVPF
jgi:hypothetical protein